MLEIAGERVVLREFGEEHLDDPRYLRWLRDPEVVAGIYRLEYLLPQPDERIRAYARSLMESETDGFFAIHAGGEFVGTTRIGHIDWRAGLCDLGVLVGDKSHWGKGVAKDAVGAAGEYAFARLSLRKLTGGTAASNTAMCRCFESLGFRREGVLRKQLLTGGEYVDHHLYGAFRDEFRTGKASS